MPKINSGRKLVKLMRAEGTGESKLDILEQIFPKNKHGEVIGDVKADDVIEHLKEYMEEHEGEIPELTMEKLVAFRTTGKWVPAVPQFKNVDAPVEFEDTPDEMVEEPKAEVKHEVKPEVKVEPKKEDEKKDKKIK